MAPVLSRCKPAFRLLTAHAVLVIAVLLALPACPGLRAQSPPLRVGIVGLVHGHVDGFLRGALSRQDLDIVGIAERDTTLAAQYGSRYDLSRIRVYRSLDAMLAEQRPEAVAVFTSTFDHRSVVEKCSRRKIAVMMEKPLAVSFADQRAVSRFFSESANACGGQVSSSRLLRSASGLDCEVGSLLSSVSTTIWTAASKMRSGARPRNGGRTRHGGARSSGVRARLPPRRKGEGRR